MAGARAAAAGDGDRDDQDGDDGQQGRTADPVDPLRQGPDRVQQAVRLHAERLRRATIGLAMPKPLPLEPFADAVLRWYDEHARDLPWRQPDASPWAVVVSEFMLQQTPVTRVLPVWAEWMRRWPMPAALAADAAGEAVRAWGRLGYPRRAMRLHAAATAMVTRHGGQVPSSYDDLRALPGVGDYTAAAVASFAFGTRTAVLDTNVRRVYRRIFDGTDDMPASPSVGERAAALARVPEEEPAHYSVAVMELGALVCTSRAPACDRCPVASCCAWLAAGRPAATS